MTLLILLALGVILVVGLTSWIRLLTRGAKALAKIDPKAVEARGKSLADRINAFGNKKIG